MRVPTNESFSSLNVAAAVQILGYEIRVTATDSSVPVSQTSDILVTSGEMSGFYHHLEETLVEIGFLDAKAPKLLMRRLKKLFNRTRPDRSELNILRGILSAVQRREKH